MKTSEKIRQRLKDKGIRFHSNDNIADFLEGDDLINLQKEVEESFSDVLDALVIDTENDSSTSFCKFARSSPSKKSAMLSLL